MVSLWPWNRDDNSPASFERTLASLSGKINAAAGDLEGKRQGLRRFKGLWTLASVLVYLVYLMVAALAIGLGNCGAIEYTIAAAGPVVIYTVRLGLTAVYEFWIERSQDRLTSLQKRRDATVKKLKEATKYDTTLQLLEKYGGGTGKPSSRPQTNRKPPSKEPSSAGSKNRLTGIVPPPTANIPSLRAPSSATGTSDKSMPFTPPPNPPYTADLSSSQWRPPSGPLEPQAEFAPNAFNTESRYVMDSSGSGWYDRLMDVLLGEDEMHPKNRLALICQNCRLVNGQAPPGAKTLEAVGKWRCSGCGTMNGVDPVMDSIASKNIESPTMRGPAGAGRVAQSAERSSAEPNPPEKEDDRNSDITQYSDEEASHPEGGKALGEGGMASGAEENGSDGHILRRSTRGKKQG